MENSRFYDQYEWFVQNVDQAKIRFLRRTLWIIVFHELHRPMTPQSLIEGIEYIIQNDLFPHQRDKKDSLGAAFSNVPITREDTRAQAEEIIIFAKSLLDQELNY